MAGWDNYFILTGTGAVTLIGLLFVVIAFGVERLEQGSAWLLRTYITPTLVHFGGVFLIALLALSPEPNGLILRFGLVGIAGSVYSVNIALRVASNAGLFSDAWVFHGGVPLACYVVILATVTTALLGVTSMRQVYLALGIISALLLIVGMRNAWAAATDIARRKILE